MRQAAVAVAVALLVPLGAGRDAAAQCGWPPRGALVKTDWDRAATIVAAAQRIAAMQRDQGAKGAFRSIDTCYEQNLGAAQYGEALEACIAQDYLQSHAVADRYARLSAAERESVAGTTPEALLGAMKQRIDSATKNYPVSFPFVAELARLVEEHGMPVYRAIAFSDEGK